MYESIYRFAQERDVLNAKPPKVLSRSRSGAVHEKSACALSAETPRFKRAVRTLTLYRFSVVGSQRQDLPVVDIRLLAVSDGYDFRGHEAAPGSYIRVEDSFWSTEYM